MKYIYLLILISLFSACKPKPDIELQEDKIYISSEDVSTLERLSTTTIDGKKEKRYYADLNDEEKTQVKNIMTNFIARHKEDLINALKIMNEESKKKGEETEDPDKIYNQLLNNPQIDDNKSPKENIASTMLIIYAMKFAKDFKLIKEKTELANKLIDDKKYTKLNQDFSLGLSDEEIISIKYDEWWGKTNITINNDKINLKDFVKFKLGQAWMVKMLIDMKLPLVASLYAKAKTEEDIENTEIPDEGLFKGMTVKELFEK